MYELEGKYCLYNNYYNILINNGSSIRYHSIILYNVIIIMTYTLVYYVLFHQFFDKQ